MIAYFYLIPVLGGSYGGFFGGSLGVSLGGSLGGSFGKSGLLLTNLTSLVFSSTISPLAELVPLILLYYLTNYL